MALHHVAEIRDPIHGYVRITEVERDVIDSPFLQRLRRIHQLAGSYLVYPGAVHTRFEHVIGTMHLAGQIAESLVENSGVKADLVQELRLAALLHDVGHGPFSHMYEEVLSTKQKVSHEDISRRIIRETSINDILESHGFSANRLSSLSIGAYSKGPQFVNEIIAGGLSADIMDYLLRDSYFTGVEYGKVDVQRVVGSLRAKGGRLALDEAALPAFEAMLLGRYTMFKTVYFHKTVRAAELMLVHSMELADDALGLTDLSDIGRYIELTDEIVLHKLVSLPQNTPELRRARQLSMDFRNRRLVKCVYERLFQRKEKGTDSLFTDSGLRLRLAGALARRAGVSPAEIFIDVPTTPSVPYTSSKQVLNSVRLLKSGRRKGKVETVPISKLPLVGSIEGFMDVLRVYAFADGRESVSEACHQFLRAGRREHSADVRL